jgi:formylglycine-generating enzyme required for sulfatase activity
MADNAKRESGRVLRVFLCHSSGDKPAVRELYQCLCAEGIDAWLDEEKLLPGQDWPLEIPKAVRASDVVIVCLSKKSVTKTGYVQKEIKFALDVADEQPEGAIFLIPARLEECDVPDRLSRWQWVNLYEARGQERLMRALRARAAELEASLSQAQARVETPAPPPVRSSGLSRLTTAKAVTASSSQSTSSIDRAGLRRQLVEHFNKEELRTLCFDLDVEYENLPDTKDGMARELVAQCERHGRIPELITACQQLRPKIVWGTSLPATPQAAPASAPRNRLELGGIEFVRVPKGKFIMGSKDDNKLAWDNEKPQHTVEIPYDYWIARYPVMNEQFAAFVQATKHQHEWVSDWKKKANHPVVNVAWRDAVAYCKWLNETLRGEIGDGVVRLPTEAEWEKAARGDAERGNEWPWGNEFDKTKCNSSEGGKSGTTPVGAYSPQGDSPYGAAGMVGNVWEWCHSIYKPYPYKADDGREESGLDVRVLRGGAWYDAEGGARCAYRYNVPPGDRLDDVGLRVVVAPNSRF